MNDIANDIQMRYPDVVELSNISAMAIQRWLTKHKKEQMRKKIATGKSVTDDIQIEFNSKMYDLVDETNDIYNIMRDALMNIIKTKDDMKTIRACKDVLVSIDQARRNWSSLIQWNTDQNATYQDARQLQIVDIDKIILNLSSHLCPRCKKEAIKVVTEHNVAERNEDIDVINEVVVNRIERKEEEKEEYARR